MAYIVMAYIVMAYISMAYTYKVMSYTVRFEGYAARGGGLVRGVRDAQRRKAGRV